jgi:perosamine synthetase
MSTVPFFRPSISEEDIAGVAGSLRTGWLTRGAKCEEFEKAFANYVGAAHAVSMNGCTTALTVALAVHGIGTGDLVLVPALTFAATAMAVLATGAKPLLVDCRPDTLSMDIDASRRALRVASGAFAGSRPAAMIPVHYGGRLIDPPELDGLADEFGLRIVHDAAHCPPAAWRSSPDSTWIRVGELSGVCCFSLYANKPITACEGGVLTSQDPDLVARARRMTQHGLALAKTLGDRRFSWDYEIEHFGLRGTMPDPLAALGLSQLQRADQHWRRRADIALRYSQRLGRGLPCDLPADDPMRVNAWHLYPIRLRTEALRRSRDEIFQLLLEHGVTCSVHYKPLHRHRAFSEWLRIGAVLASDLQQVDQIWPRLLSLPIYPDLCEDDQGRVCDVLEQVLLDSTI